ncbi:YciI family protein [Amycolatopsis orientalis]|uniref:YciI family protein n=1 Tax=Amycolatopsis orientalis TaxID=31958 RepID=UPI00039E74B0|nr:YciI family protein [Amycolatopsis orientalis]
MEFVVMYRVREGIDRSRILEVFPRHRAFYEKFRADGGGLLALGPFSAPDPAAGSMGIFRSREDAERFIAADPFVVEGLAEARILEWDVVRFE